ncbi:hypothetical protein H632_c3878p0, partial [Helicosporidium sp. ATCC 50920]
RADNGPAVEEKRADNGPVTEEKRADKGQANGTLGLENQSCSSSNAALPPFPMVKLCDFQFAKYWGTPHMARMTTHLGTAVYMAPEVLTNRTDRRSYDPVEADVWACGIWLVALLVGAFPFDNRPGVDDRTAEMQILHQEINTSWRGSKFVQPYVGAMSAEAQDLIDHVLAVDPTKRYSLAQINRHPWMTRELPGPMARAWATIREAQATARAEMKAQPHDDELVMQRNNVIFALIRESATHLDPVSSFERLAAMPALAMVESDAAHLVVRVDVSPAAVARRKGYSNRVRELLDADADVEGAEQRGLLIEGEKEAAAGAEEVEAERRRHRHREGKHREHRDDKHREHRDDKHR